MKPSSPLTQEPSFIHTPGKSASPFQGKSSMKLIPTNFPTTFPPLSATPSTAGTHMEPTVPAYYINPAYNPHTTPLMYGGVGATESYSLSWG